MCVCVCSKHVTKSAITTGSVASRQHWWVNADYEKQWDVTDSWSASKQKKLPFNGRLSGTTRVGRYQKKHSPTHTHPDHRASFITFLHLQRSTASSLFSLCAWQSSQTTSFQVLFALPLGHGPSTSYSMYFFTQSSSSFRSTCPVSYTHLTLPTKRIV